MDSILDKNKQIENMNSDKCFCSRCREDIQLDWSFYNNFWFYLPANSYGKAYNLCRQCFDEFDESLSNFIDSRVGGLKTDDTDKCCLCGHETAFDYKYNKIDLMSYLNESEICLCTVHAQVLENKVINYSKSLVSEFCKRK